MQANRVCWFISYWLRRWVVMPANDDIQIRNNRNELKTKCKETWNLINLSRMWFKTCCIVVKLEVRKRYTAPDRNDSNRKIPILTHNKLSQHFTFHIRMESFFFKNNMTKVHSCYWCLEHPVECLLIGRMWTRFHDR